MKSLAIQQITNITINNHLTVSSLNKQVYLISKNLSIIQRIDYSEPILFSITNDKLTISSSPFGSIFFNEKKIKTNCGGIEKINQYRNNFVVGGWNKKINILNEQRIEQEYTVNHKINYSTIINDSLICADSFNTFFYDLRNMKNYFDKKECKNINCLINFRDNGYSFGTKLGKIYIENENKFAFNGHTKIIDDKKYLFSVNVLFFEKNLFSCGSDGRIIEWDITKKKMKKVWHEGNEIKKVLINENLMYFVEKNENETNLNVKDMS
ncbi:mitotic spindle checkpoint protein Bub3 [Gurleya vavrai]